MTHARSLREADAQVRLMISVEMIGTFDDAHGSQTFPVATKTLIYPDTGNFIAVVGRDAGLVAQVAGGMKAASGVPVETLSAPAGVPGTDLSDHRSFWAVGYPAVMVTDTAFYRNPRYHTSRDRPERLDYRRMAEVVEGIACAVQAVAGR
ncbi:MAG: M28 family peptidase [Anaeromyxobacter sp.]